MDCVKFVVVLCKLRGTVVAVALAVIMMWVIATAALHRAMDVFFVGLVDEFYLFLWESFKGTSLETDRVGKGLIVCLCNVACFEQKGEKLLNKEDSGRLWV